MPVVRELKDFDRQSGNRLERFIFNQRIVVVLLCAIVTLILGLQAGKLSLNASFEKTMPREHPYSRNYLDNRQDLRGLGNSLRVVVENAGGDIFDPGYL